MNEKVLIKSTNSKKTTIFFISAIAILIVLAFSLLFLGIKQDLEQHFYYFEVVGLYACKLCDHKRIAKDAVVGHILTTHGDDLIVYQLVALFLIFLAVLLFLTYLSMKRSHITITDSNIFGKTFWGKEVVLPIHMVSAFSTSKSFSVIAITTSSGFIKFHGIGNYKEIAVVLQQLINEKQQKPDTQENTSTNQSDLKNLDYLIKLKNLLDNNIITQEEFDIKKKELFGL